MNSQHKNPLTVFLQPLHISVHTENKPDRICSPVLPMLEKVVTKANCVMFFGTQLCAYDTPPICSNHSDFAACNPEFLKAALQYTKHVFITAEIMRLTPKLLAPYSFNFVAL